ncbi:MAG: hypothetical protein ACO1RA_16015 [Planctomycetaceae bacterium]
MKIGNNAIPGLPTEKQLRMNARQLLLSRLTLPYSVDEWSEYVIHDVVSIANQLTETDWEDLCSNWNALQPIQQIRIAEIASGIEKPSCGIGTMLVQMFSSSDADLVEASLDSINAIMQRDDSVIPLSSLQLALSGFVIKGKTGNAILNRVKHLLEKRSSKTAGQ